VDSALGTFHFDKQPENLSNMLFGVVSTLLTVVCKQTCNCAIFRDIHSRFYLNVCKQTSPSHYALGHMVDSLTLYYNCKI